MAAPIRLTTATFGLRRTPSGKREISKFRNLSKAESRMRFASGFLLLVRPSQTLRINTGFEVQREASEGREALRTADQEIGVTVFCYL